MDVLQVTKLISSVGTAKVETYVWCTCSTDLNDNQVMLVKITAKWLLVPYRWGTHVKRCSVGLQVGSYSINVDTGHRTINHIQKIHAVMYPNELQWTWSFFFSGL